MFSNYFLGLYNKNIYYIIKNKNFLLKNKKLLLISRLINENFKVDVIGDIIKGPIINLDIINKKKEDILDRLYSIFPELISLQLEFYLFNYKSIG